MGQERNHLGTKACCTRIGIRDASVAARRNRLTARAATAVLVVGVLVVLMGIPAKLLAAVSDVQATDVTTRAFSVVWASDIPVIAASVRVFTDSAGTAEITAGLSVQVVAPAGALGAGLVKVDVVGVEPDTTYFYQAINDGVISPPAGPLPAVQTASRMNFATTAGTHLANTVLLARLFKPDATTPAAAALLLVEAPGLSRHPVSGFVGGGGAAAPDVIVDLNNLYALATGENLVLAAGTPLRLTAYRGLDCPGLADHLLARLRRVPPAPSTPAITEVATADTCFAPNGIAMDFNCDTTIDGLDTDRFREQFPRETSVAAPNCAFHPDFDPTQDLRVGVGDFNLLMSVLGAQE